MGAGCGEAGRLLSRPGESFTDSGSPRRWTLPGLCEGPSGAFLSVEANSRVGMGRFGPAVRANPRQEGSHFGHGTIGSAGSRGQGACALAPKKGPGRSELFSFWPSRTQSVSLPGEYKCLPSGACAPLTTEPVCSQAEALRGAPRFSARFVGPSGSRWLFQTILFRKLLVLVNSLESTENQVSFR